MAFWHILSRPDRHWEEQVSVLDICDDDNGIFDGDNDGDGELFWLIATKY